MILCGVSTRFSPPSQGLIKMWKVIRCIPPSKPTPQPTTTPTTLRTTALFNCFFYSVSASLNIFRNNLSYFDNINNLILSVVKIKITQAPNQFILFCRIDSFDALRLSVSGKGTRGKRCWNIAVYYVGIQVSAYCKLTLFCDQIRRTDFDELVWGEKIVSLHLPVLVTILAYTSKINILCKKLCRL